MKCDPKNAVLPANRAMAKLKLKEWNSVESDCTLSIRYIYIFNLGVKVRNLKMDFNTGGTWRRVGQGNILLYKATK